MWLWDYLYYKWRERNRAAGDFLDFGRVVFWMVACLVAGTLLGLDAMGVLNQVFPECLVFYVGGKKMHEFSIECGIIMLEHRKLPEVDCLYV